MELKERNCIPEIELIGNKGIIFRWTGEPVERVEASESENQGESESAFDVRESQRVQTGSEWAQGVTGERRIVRIGRWRTIERRRDAPPYLSPENGALIHRKWSVFNRDNALTVRGVPNAFAAVLTRPLLFSSSPRSKGVRIIPRRTHNYCTCRPTFATFHFRRVVGELCIYIPHVSRIVEKFCAGGWYHDVRLLKGDLVDIQIWKSEK